jgi:hypothetical protein
MKKILFLLAAAVCALAACDPVHEDISNGGHITADELKAMSKVIVDKVVKIGDQKTYTATKGTPIVLMENVDVQDCNGVILYFDKAIDKNWEVSFLPDGSFEKLPGGITSYRCDFGKKELGSLKQLVLKHTEDTEENTITVKAIYKSYGYKVAPGKEGQYGNVIVCETSAPVNAKWDFAGKEIVGNYAWKKMKVNWDENGDFVKTPYTIVLTGICPDGTKLTVNFPVECDEVSNPLVKYYIYGNPNRSDDEKAEDPQLPFKPGAWAGAAMRFSSTEAQHFPTIADEVYFGLKTLILDVSEAEGTTMLVNNGWWSNTYYDNIVINDGANEIPITQQIADECAKGGEGRDLQFIFKSGNATVNSVYYEE